MFNYLQKKLIAILGISTMLFLSGPLWAQDCDGQEQSLPDAQIIVSSDIPNNPEAYCVPFTFDASLTGYPTGITMNLWHQYEGDLSITVSACGEVLNVLQRPGEENGNCDTPLCTEGSGNCGSSAQIGFEDAPVGLNFFNNGPEPDDGISQGGTFGLTQDDNCGVGTLSENTFEALWSNCGGGIVDAEICFADHAHNHRGYVSDLNFIFPNPVTCGCTDPGALNYNPDAGINDGNCLYTCPDVGLSVNENSFTICAGVADTLELMATADETYDPFFTWFVNSGPTDIFSRTNRANTLVYIPADFVGTIELGVFAINDLNCDETLPVTISVVPSPDATIVGNLSVCPGDSTLLTVQGASTAATYMWSTGQTGSSSLLGVGNYSVTITDPASSCAQELAVEVTAGGAPQPTILGPDTICLGTTAQLAVLDTFATYQWSTSDTLPQITVDTAATYALTVTNASGCAAIDTFVLTNFPSTPLTVLGDTSQCFGDSVQWQATPGFNTYIWSNGDTSAITWVTDTLPLSLLVADSNACIQTVTQALTWTPLPTPAISGDTLLCPGGSVGLASVDTFSTYQWSTGDTTQTILATTAGTYELLVTDSLGCNATAIQSVETVTLPVLRISGDSLFCPEGNTTLTASTGFTDYQWSTGDAAATITTSNPGLIYVTATHVTGCTAVDSFLITNYQVATLDIIGEEEICTGDSTQLATPPGFTNFIWSTSVTTPTIHVSTAGTYQLMALDSNSCQVQADFELAIRPLPIVEISGPSLLCAEAEGLLGATSGFNNYEWSVVGEITNQITAGPGQYEVTVSDDLGCENAASFVIANASPQVTTIETANFCAGDTLLLSVVDTFPTYQWSTGSDMPAVQVTEPGSFVLTVTNANNCSATISYTVNESPLPTPVLQGPTDICPETAAILEVNDNYVSYAWSIAGENGTALQIEEAGTYSVTVTDENGCAASATQTVEVFPVAPITISGDTSFCAGESLVLTASDGFETYEWNNGGVGTTAGYSLGGEVTVTVSDSNNCETSASIVLTENPLPEPMIVGDTLFCPGQTTSLEVLGDFASYQWSNGVSTASLETGQEGPIALVVVDENGCTGTEQLTLATFPAPTVVMNAPEGVCEGTEALLSTTLPFSAYSWSTGTNDPTLNIDSGGTYSLTVSDENGCTAFTTQEVQDFPVAPVTISGDTSFCAGESLLLTASGGFQTYQWSNGSANNTAEYDAGGEVTVIAIDENDCESSATVLLNENPLPEPQIIGNTVFCPGEATNLEAMGNYVSYEWSNGVAAAALVTDQVGPLSLTVVDQNGCSGVAGVELTTFPMPTVVIDGPAGLCEDTEALLSTTLPFATYEWSTGASDASISINMSGTYELTITDDNGCSAADTLSLLEFSNPAPVLLGATSFCTGTNTVLQVEGEENWTFNWSDGSMADSLVIQTEGMIEVTATDGNGCWGSTSVEVTMLPLPEPNIVGATLFCPEEDTELTLDQAYVTYNWSTGDTTSAVSINNSATLEVTVTDENGCSGSTIAAVNTYPAPSLSLPVLDPICSGDTLLFTAPAGFATYLWPDGSTETAYALAAGDSVILIVTDANNCSTAGLAYLPAFSLPEPTLDGSLVFCNGNSTVLTVDGVSEVSYLWSTGEVTAGITVDTTSVVAVTVTDSNGCSGAAMATVEETAALQPSIEGAIPFCPGTTTTLSASSSYASYLWSDGSIGESLTITEPGLYTLSVADDFGCTGAVSLQVDHHVLPNVVLVGDSLICNNETTIWQVLGDVNTYSWSTTQDSAQVELSEGGNYDVTVTDDNGCEQALSANLTVLPLPEPTIVGELSLCENSTTTLTVENDYVSYQWTSGSAEQSTVIAVGQSVGITITDTNGCTGTTSVQTTAIPLPLADAGANGLLTCTEDAVALGSSTNPTGEDFAYAWSGPGITNENNTAPSPLVEVAGSYTLQIVNLENGCQSLPATVEVTDIREELEVTIEASDELDCETETVTLDASDSAVGEHLQYQWFNQDNVPITGANSLVLEVDNPQQFTLLVVDTLSGCTGMDTIEVVTQVAYPIVSAGEDQTLTCGEPSATLAGMVSPNGGITVSEWLDASGNPIAATNVLATTTTEGGLYQLIATDTTNGCIAVDTVWVLENLTVPTAVTTGDEVFSCVEAEVTVSGEGSSTGPTLLYQWLLAGEPITGATALNWTSSEPGVYSFVVFDTANACADTASLVISPDPLAPESFVLTSQPPACLGDANGMISINEVVGGVGPFVFSLNEGGFSTQQAFTDLTTGTYEVVLEDANGCQLTNTVELPDGADVWVDLGGDQEVKWGDPVTVFTQLSIDSTRLASFSWSADEALPCPTCLNQPPWFLDESTRLFLTVTDVNGCTDTDDVLLLVNKEQNIYVPNAFSPDDDGTNDRFFPFTDQRSVKEIKLFQVFNRWGEHLFENRNFQPNNPQEGWDGRHRGEPPNPAVYAWYLEVELVSGEIVTLKGDVVLVD